MNSGSQRVRTNPNKKNIENNKISRRAIMAFNSKNNNDFNFKEIHKNNKYLNTFKEKITINKDLKKDSFKYENEIPNNIVKIIIKM